MTARAQLPPGRPAPPRIHGPPPQGTSRLITDPTDREALTARCEVDARTALTRSLKEYLEQLSFVDAGGAERRFKHVIETWAEPEDMAEMPSAAIYGAARGSWDASSFTPGINPTLQLPAPDSRYVVKTCEYSQDLVVDIWAAEPAVRSALASMVEKQLSPVEWMFGMRLEVPYYHGARATFEPRFADYEDSDPGAAKRWRRAFITVTARIPVIRIKGLPLLQTQLDIVTGSDLSVPTAGAMGEGFPGSFSG